MTHYIVTQGDHGYAPNSVNVFSDYESALDYADSEIKFILDSEYDNGMSDEMIDFTIESMQADIRDSGIADFDLSEYDLSYISIEPCDCDQPCNHDESAESLDYCPHCIVNKYESADDYTPITPAMLAYKIESAYRDQLWNQLFVARELGLSAHADIIDQQLESHDVLFLNLRSKAYNN